MENDPLFVASDLKECEQIAFVTQASLPGFAERRIKQNPEMRELFYINKGLLQVHYFDLLEDENLQFTSYKTYPESSKFEIPTGQVYKLRNELYYPVRWLAIGITTNSKGVARFFEEADNIRIF